MKTIRDYLDDAKAKTGSDYRTALRLGVSRQYISRARDENQVSEDVALALADLLEINPMPPIAANNAQKTKSPALKARWEQLAGKFIAAGVLVISSLCSSTDARAATSLHGAQNGDNLYIMRLLRKLRTALSTQFLRIFQTQALPVFAR